MYTNQITDPRNSAALTRAYFDSILIETRHLDNTAPDTSFQLYGKSFSTPIMTAAFSHLNGTRENGMAEMARGAYISDAVNWAGMGSEEELDGIINTGASTIKIVKPYADRKMVMKKFQHAYKAGALAIGMDIDHSFDYKGLPDCIEGMTMSPVTCDELRGFVKSTPLPFIVKGVLSVQDAVKCRECGVKGILVSHHHGIIPYAVPPLMILPEIVKAVGDDMDIFVDCSVASGADAFKALALGAKGVCVGRAVLDSLKNHGAEGVKGYIDSMTDELRGIMARTGSADLKSISSDMLWINKI